MIDFAVAISNTGVILFYLRLLARDPDRQRPDDQRRHIIDSYLRDNVVIKRTDHSKPVIISNLKIFCKINTILGIVFLVAHNKIFDLAYTDELLSFFSQSFCNYFFPDGPGKISMYDILPVNQYTDLFVVKMKSLVAQSHSNSQVQNKKMKSFAESHKSQKTISSSKNNNNSNKKQSRSWEDSTKHSKQQLSALNFSENEKNHVQSIEEDKKSINTSSSSQRMIKNDNDTKNSDIKDHGHKNDDRNIKILENIESFNSQNKSSSSFFESFLPSSLLNRTLDDNNLKEPLERLKQRLIMQNVAQHVAEQLVTSVHDELYHQNLTSFSSVSKKVHDTLQRVCTRIIEGPSSSNSINHSTKSSKISILTEIKQRRLDRSSSLDPTKHRPYSIVFCGVNGVGKSTNLAKIAAWLLKNNMRVLIGACDTFRSGAIEQLNTHIRKLRAYARDNHWSIMSQDNDCATSQCLSLFTKGYGKDAAEIAKEAIEFAELKGFDVVLIDTAGRMQDNAPLMASLAKLIRINRPDRVLFVGEALVGNEAVDQILKFDAALSNPSESNNSTTDCAKIDGIILTKFDTVDTKVGAALSMTFVTGKPIVFVGVGQNYEDLRKLDASSVVNDLLRD